MPNVRHAHGPADKSHAAYVEGFNGFSDKEGVLLEVGYPPGGSDPIHRHNAYVFVYVLEGTVVMQVKGREPVTLSPGQTFYEGSQRRSYRWPQCRQDQTGHIYCVLHQG
jgi:quercetin dioxygenase-like cupin family protein